MGLYRFYVLVAAHIKKDYHSKESEEPMYKLTASSRASSLRQRKGESMKTKFDIAHDLLAILGTIKDLELEVRKLKKEVEKECWQFRDKQEAENRNVSNN